MGRISVPTGSAAYALVAHGESTVEVVNSTTETDLFSYTVPAGSLAAGDRLRISAGIDFLNNSGGSVTYTPKLLLGATSILPGLALGVSSNTNRRYGSLDAVVAVVSTAAQRAHGSIVAVGGSSSFPGSTGSIIWSGTGTGTEDLTAALDLKFSVTLGTAHASADFNLQNFSVERIRA
jgi:hypothetical protein